MGWKFVCFYSLLSLSPFTYKPEICSDPRRKQDGSHLFAKCYICAAQVSELSYRNCSNFDCNLLFLFSHTDFSYFLMKALKEMFTLEPPPPWFDILRGNQLDSTRRPELSNRVSPKAGNSSRLIQNELQLLGLREESLSWNWKKEGAFDQHFQ